MAARVNEIHIFGMEKRKKCDSNDFENQFFGFSGTLFFRFTFD